MKANPETVHLGKPDGCFNVPACGADMGKPVTSVRGGVTCRRCRKIHIPPETVHKSVRKAIPGRVALCRIPPGPTWIPATSGRWAKVTCKDCLAMRRKKGGYAY